jgi:hypothetical protein
VAGHRAVGRLRGALGDVDHVGDAVLALAGLAAGLAQRPAGAQALREIAAQRACGLHIQRLVDRFGETRISGSSGNSTRSLPAICSGE